MNRDFQYYLPVNLIFGVGKVERLGAETAKYGRKALLVTGKGSTKRTGLLNRALSLLAEEGVEVSVFDKEGIEESDIDWMVKNCLKVSAASMNAHPKFFSEEEIRDLCYKAL